LQMIFPFGDSKCYDAFQLNP